MSREKRTILIVDGSSTMLFYLGMLLKRLEYAVITVRSGEDALKTLERAIPSAVLTEVALPVMSGIELVKTMKKDQRYVAVPVVVLTSDRDATLRANCLAVGSAAVLHKPVEPDDLYKTLQAALESTPRSHIRLNTSLKVIVGDGSAAGGAERAEYASALSEGGLYVRTNYPQPQNAVTPIRIFLGEAEIRTKALVLYSFAGKEGPYQEPGMGMRFVELADRDRLLIREFIKEQLTRDIGS